LAKVAHSEHVAATDEKPISSIATEQGFLIVDGVYVEPPYAINLDGESIRINGTVFDTSSLDLSGLESPGHGSGRGMRGERRMGYGGPRRMRSEWTPRQKLFDQIGLLELGAMVVLSSEKTPMVLWPERQEHELLKALMTAGSMRGQAIEVPTSVTAQGQQQSWQQLLEGFQATPQFIERASQEIERANAATAIADRELAAKKWSDRLIYTLTMIAIVLVVVAAGHLMADAQSVFSVTQVANPELAPLINRNVIRSLMIVAGLSMIDLIWTLIAHQSGLMRELNPIGNQLIDDPVQLVSFKVLVTGLSIGLLYWLRQNPFARKATWWCCLVLTLLTARWLTFHSLLA
jgi:hypothetical protein